MKPSFLSVCTVVSSVLWPIVFVSWLLGDEPMPASLVGTLIVCATVYSWADLAELLSRKRAGLRVLKTIDEIRDTIAELRARQ
jgi:hypothetical protein